MVKAADERRFQFNFLIIGISVGILNALSVQITFLSFFVASLQYIFVFFLLLQRKYFESFSFFLLFIVLTLEMDTFLLGESAITDTVRYTFLELPFLHNYVVTILSVLYYYHFKKNNYSIAETEENRKFRKWLYVLFITGAISVMVGYVIDDNGIRSSGNYPILAFREMFYFFNRFIIIYISLLLVRSEFYLKKLKEDCYLILIVIVYSSIIVTFIFGIIGHYGDYDLMMTPLAIAYTPCIIIFASSKNIVVKNSSLLSAILIILSTFIYPTCIGSKWYLIIFLSLFAWILLISGIKSLKTSFIIVSILIAILLINMDSLLSMMGNDYVGWKLRQSLNLINVFNNDSGTDISQNLDRSTLYRFDEISNIVIEYINKPAFAIFGKGFAGTIRHYTDLLSWETDPGAFSEMQVKMGAYYNLHESFTVILLRHGLIGLIFICYIIEELIKRITITPWATISIVWFVFYWSYGMSLIIGGIILVITFSMSTSKANDNKHLSSKH